MATVVNDRDVLIMGTTPRYTPPTDRGMFLTPSAAVFRLSDDGLTASPSSFQFVATLLNMTGNVTWSTTDGISLSVNGNTATLDFASFTAVSGTITATIMVDGDRFTQIATVTKLANGSIGPRGARGNVDIAAVTSGSVWSDSEAAAALAGAGYGAPQVRDLVKLYKSDRTFSVQKMYNGSTWVAVDYVYDGSVFVKGSILPEAIDTRGLTIRDASGNIILNAGATLASQVGTSPNLVSRISSWGGYKSGGAVSYTNSSYPAINGENIILPGGQAGVYIAYESDAIPIYANEWYTVSFWALTEDAAAGNLALDMYGTGAGGALVDTVGIGCNPPSWTPQRYTFTEQMPSTGNGAQRLRVFNPGGAERKQIRIWDIKVERGKKATAWCDNIITPWNISTFIMGAAISQAQIANAAIGQAQIANAAVGTAQIGTAQIKTGHIDNAQIKTAHIDYGQITNALIGNAAVDSLQLAGQAVTIPLAASTIGATSVAIGTSATIQSVWFVSAGAPISITFGATIAPAKYLSNVYNQASQPTAVPWWLELWRDGTRLITVNGPDSRDTSNATVSFTLQDRPGAGGYTYQLVLVQGGSGQTQYSAGSASNRNILLLETKR